MSNSSEGSSQLTHVPSFDVKLFMEMLKGKFRKILDQALESMIHDEIY